VTRREWLEQLGGVTGRLLDDLRDDHAPALRRLQSDLAELHARVSDELDEERRDHPRLLVFLCGTALMHGSAAGVSREERVVQARAGTDPSLRDYGAYVPTEGAIEKLRGWSDQGAEITYLSDHRDPVDVEASAGVVRTYGFPAGSVLYRRDEETFGDLVQQAAPDIFIVDDATATGSHDAVLSILVPEFGGLGHLPASVAQLS
jgi:hypothetical protein